MFNYRLTEENETLLVINLEGPFDSAGAQTLLDALQSYDLTKVEKVVFEMSNVTLMASLGLRVILMARDKLKGDIRVELRGAQGLVAKVIQMSGIGKLVEVT